MKFRVLLLTGFLFLLSPNFASCSNVDGPAGPENPENPDPKKPDEPSKPEAETFTFTVSPLKGKWEAGDKIYVHGSYGPVAQTVTLSASDISADGKVATATLGAVLEYPLNPDRLYAAWPGENVLEMDGVMDEYTDFAEFGGLLSVAYLSGTDFSFADASSCLTFKVSGYTDFALAGNMRPGLNFTKYRAMITSSDSDFYERKDDGYPFIYGNISNGAATLWIPGTITMKTGFTIYLGKDGEWPVSFSITEDTRLTAGQVLDLGDITPSLTPYSGPKPELPRMQGQKRLTVSLNELSGIYPSADGTFLWGVGDDGDLARISFEGKVISKVHIGSDDEDVTIDPTTGNLLVGCEPNTVRMVAAPDYNKLVKLFAIDEAKGYDNAGLEGLTYYKDGMVYAGMQTGSELYCCKLETGEKVWMKPMRKLFPSITEIAGLFYDALTDWLWIVDSEAKKVFVLTGDAENMLGTYSIKSPTNPESVCIDHVNSCMWVGDDYGSTSYLYRFDMTGLEDAVIENN